MTQQKPRILVAGLVVAALLLMIAIAGDGDVAGMPNTPLMEKAEGAAAPRPSRGVSASTATLLAGGLGLVGVVIGLFGERYFRHRGDIRCKLSGWSLTYTLHRDPRPKTASRSLFQNKYVIGQAKHGGYYVRVNLFNETEVDTGLRDIRVAFTDDSGIAQKVYVPTMVDSKKFSMDPDAVNLPARQWVAMRLEGKVETEDFEVLARSTTAKLTAWLPMDKPFERRLARLWD